MDKELVLHLGVIVEKRAVDHPWLDESWKPVAVIDGTPEEFAAYTPWQIVRTEEKATQYFAGAASIVLHRKETEAYQHNLMSKPPAVFVVLRDTDDEPDNPAPFAVAHVTVSPYEAQDFLDSGEDIIERVTMPERIMAVLTAFIEFHHQDEPFRKRKRDRVRVEDEKFGKEPIFGRTRMEPGEDA